MFQAARLFWTACSFSDGEVRAGSGEELLAHSWGLKKHPSDLPPTIASGPILNSFIFLQAQLSVCITLPCMWLIICSIRFHGSSRCTVLGPRADPTRTPPLHVPGLHSFLLYCPAVSGLITHSGSPGALPRGGTNSARAGGPQGSPGIGWKQAPAKKQPCSAPESTAPTVPGTGILTTGSVSRKLDLRFTKRFHRYFYFMRSRLLSTFSQS